MAASTYHTFNINLSKDFLKNIHSHRLIAEVKDIPEDLYNQAWMNTPEVTTFRFGGIYNQQFTSFDEIREFNQAFDRLLYEKSISSTHKDSLLYLIRFLEQDFERQAIQQAQYNRLRDYSDFLSNLYFNGYSHIQNMEKNKDYSKKVDHDGGQIFFAKNHLIESMSLKELCEYVPPKKTANDIVKYLTIPIGKYLIYIPKDTSPQIANKSTMKAVDGETLSVLTFPNQIKFDLLKYTVNTMMEEHKSLNTEFYKLFQSDELHIEALKELYKAARKHKISNIRDLVRIGVIVSDYLIENKLMGNKTSIAAFLWGYFALFKAYRVSGNSLPPDNYSDLKSYYLNLKIDKEYVRNLMKDAHKFGDF